MDGRWNSGAKWIITILKLMLRQSTLLKVMAWKVSLCTKWKEWIDFTAFMYSVDSCLQKTEIQKINILFKCIRHYLNYLPYTYKFEIFAQLWHRVYTLSEDK